MDTLQAFLLGFGAIAVLTLVEIQCWRKCQYELGRSIAVAWIVVSIAFSLTLWPYRNELWPFETTGEIILFIIDVVVCIALFQIAMEMNFRDGISKGQERWYPELDYRIDLQVRQKLRWYAEATTEEREVFGIKPRTLPTLPSGCDTKFMLRFNEIAQKECTLPLELVPAEEVGGYRIREISIKIPRSESVNK